MAKNPENAGKKEQPIIIKKIKKGGGGHHGGAWKVAYADFVTAMMAFFLLLWLLNVTTEEQKNAISNYFDPTAPQVSRNESGAGGVMGGLSVAEEGAMTTNLQAPAPPPPNPQAPQPLQPKQSAEHTPEQQLRDELKRREEKRFSDVKKAIENAVKNNPDMKDLLKNLKIDMTDEGLRIQIVDQDGEPMFPSGSAQMYAKTRNLMTLVARTIATMPNNISVRGHTDSVRYARGGNYTNWELSADRANASRRVLLGAGIAEARLANVVGKAATEPLITNNPKDSQNRRISIILLRQNNDAAVSAATAASSATGTAPSSLSTLSDTPDVPAEPDRLTITPSEGKVKFP
ncbi:MAG: flagellar motor protein MotB [Pseudomonadota bacterium]